MSNRNACLSTVLGPGGCGKTSRAIMPQVIKTIEAGQSFLLCDPKEDAWGYLGEALRLHAYNIISLNLRNPDHSMSWNPLLPSYQLYMAGEKLLAYSLLSDMARNVYEAIGEKQNDFWGSSACSLFVAIVSSLFDKANVDEINLKSVCSMVVLGEERYATSNYLKEYFQLEPVNSYPFIQAHAAINAPNDTKGGIMTTLKNSLLRMTANDKFEQILCFNDFGLDDCLKEKTAIIINYEDENSTNAQIATIFIDMLLKTLIDRRTKEKKARVFHFFLDDFLSLPKLYSFDDVVMAAPSRNIALTVVLNSKHLFEKRYGKETFASLIANSDTIIYFRDNDVEFWEYLEKLYRQKRRALPIDTDESPVILSDSSNFNCGMPSPLSQRNSGKWEYVNRHTDEKIRVFAIKEYVAEQRKKRIDAMQTEPNSLELSKLMAEIDRKMQELEATESNKRK